MKLYNVYMNNGWDYDDEADHNVLIVAEDIDKANTRAQALLLESYKSGDCNEPYYIVAEVKEVDNYLIYCEKLDWETGRDYNE